MKHKYDVLRAAAIRWLNDIHAVCSSNRNICDIELMGVEIDTTAAKSAYYILGRPFTAGNTDTYPLYSCSCVDCLGSRVLF